MFWVCVVCCFFLSLSLFFPFPLPFFPFYVLCLFCLFFNLFPKKKFESLCVCDLQEFIQKSMPTRWNSRVHSCLVGLTCPVQLSINNFLKLVWLEKSVHFFSSLYYKGLMEMSNESKWKKMAQFCTMFMYVLHQCMIQKLCHKKNLKKRHSSLTESFSES